MITVEEYVDRLGRNRFEEWRVSLDFLARTRMDRAVERLGMGNESNLKPVGLGVIEMKLNFGPGYRIYLGRGSKSLVLLLTGGSKARQSHDTELAQRLWQEYLEDL